MAEPFRALRARRSSRSRAENVDTDQIVPARYLKVTDKEGLADALFRDWRFNEDGSPQGPAVRPRPSRAWPGRKILLVGDNFGTGQLARARAVGAAALGHPGDPVHHRSPTSSAATRSRTACCRSSSTRPRTSGCSSSSSRDPDAELRVDLAEQGILLPDGSTIDFDIDPFAKLMLLAGTDEIGYVLDHEDAIAAWEAVHPPRVDTRLGSRCRLTSRDRSGTAPAPSSSALA